MIIIIIIISIYVYIQIFHIWLSDQKPPGQGRFSSLCWKVNKQIKYRSVI